MTNGGRSGMPKLRIEEAAARRQARVDRGEDVIVGVNKYKTDDSHAVDILDVDNAKVRESQIARLNTVQGQAAMPARVTAALTALSKAAEDGSGNLLELTVAAMRARATLGEVSERAGAGLRPAQGGGALDRRRLRRGLSRRPGFPDDPARRSRFRPGRGPPAAPPGGEARPGRP